jgi:hypothetical protein
MPDHVDSSGAGPLIVRLDEDESHFVIVDLLITEYLLGELTASQLLRPIMLILWASLFGSH